MFNKLKTIINNKQDEEENIKRMELENRIKLEKELLSLSSKKRLDPNNNKIRDRNLNENKVKYSRNTDFKKLSPLKMSKRDKFGFEIEGGVQTHKSQIMVLNRNLISGHYNVENLNTLSNTNSNKKGSLNAVNKQVDLDAKLNLKNEFNLVKERISNVNNIMSAGIDKDNKIEHSISEKNRTLKNLDILNYGEDTTNYDNTSSTIFGVNRLSSNQLSLNDIKNYLKENMNTEKNLAFNNTNTNSTNNNLNQIIASSKKKTKSSSLITNKINQKANKRSNSLTSLDNKIDNAQSKLLDLFSSNPESEVARINASYEAKSPRKKVSTIELDLIRFNDPDSKRISRSSNNVLFNNTAKTKSAENKSKNSAIKISNNNIHENFFLHTNSNAASTNQITSGHFVNTSASNITKNNKVLFNNDEKDFTARLKSLNNLFLTTEENNKLTTNAADNANMKINEKMKDLDFNFIHSKNFKTIDRTNNSLLATIESSNKKARLFDDKITFSSNTINNNLAKKISSFSNISNQAKIKLNEINSMTERLKSLGDKDKKAEDLFKNKNLFIESKKLDTEEALHKSILS